jgi:hypothetical protein
MRRRVVEANGLPTFGVYDCFNSVANLKLALLDRAKMNIRFAAFLGIRDGE